MAQLLSKMSIIRLDSTMGLSSHSNNCNVPLHLLNTGMINMINPHANIFQHISILI